MRCNKPLAREAHSRSRAASSPQQSPVWRPSVERRSHATSSTTSTSPDTSRIQKQPQFSSYYTEGSVNSVDDAGATTRAPSAKSWQRPPYCPSAAPGDTPKELGTTTPALHAPRFFHEGFLHDAIASSAAPKPLTVREPAVGHPAASATQRPLSEVSFYSSRAAAASKDAPSETRRPRPPLAVAVYTQHEVGAAAAHTLTKRQFSMPRDGNRSSSSSPTSFHPGGPTQSATAPIHHMGSLTMLRHVTTPAAEVTSGSSVVATAFNVGMATAYHKGVPTNTNNEGESREGQQQPPVASRQRAGFMTPPKLQAEIGSNSSNSSTTISDSTRRFPRTPSVNRRNTSQIASSSSSSALRQAPATTTRTRIDSIFSAYYKRIKESSRKRMDSPAGAAVLAAPPKKQPLTSVVAPVQNGKGGASNLSHAEIEHLLEAPGPCGQLSGVTGDPLVLRLLVDYLWAKAGQLESDNERLWQLRGSRVNYLLEPPDCRSTARGEEPMATEQAANLSHQLGPGTHSPRHEKRTTVPRRPSKETRGTGTPSRGETGCEPEEGQGKGKRSSSSAASEPLTDLEQARWQPMQQGQWQGTHGLQSSPVAATDWSDASCYSGAAHMGTTNADGRHGSLLDQQAVCHAAGSEVSPRHHHILSTSPVRPPVSDEGVTASPAAIDGSLLEKSLAVNRSLHASLASASVDAPGSRSAVRYHKQAQTEHSWLLEQSVARSSTPSYAQRDRVAIIELHTDAAYSRDTVQRLLAYCLNLERTRVDLKKAVVQGNAKRIADATSCNRSRASHFGFTNQSVQSALQCVSSSTLLSPRQRSHFRSNYANPETNATLHDVFDSAAVDTKIILRDDGIGNVSKRVVETVTVVDEDGSVHQSTPPAALRPLTEGCPPSILLSCGTPPSQRPTVTPFTTAKIREAAKGPRHLSPSPPSSVSGNSLLDACTSQATSQSTLFLRRSPSYSPRSQTRPPTLSDEPAEEEGSAAAQNSRCARELYHPLTASDASCDELELQQQSHTVPPDTIRRGSATATASSTHLPRASSREGASVVPVATAPANHITPSLSVDSTKAMVQRVASASNRRSRADGGLPPSKQRAPSSRFSIPCSNRTPAPSTIANNSAVGGMNPSIPASVAAPTHRLLSSARYCVR